MHYIKLWNDNLYTKDFYSKINKIHALNTVFQFNLASDKNSFKYR